MANQKLDKRALLIKTATVLSPVIFALAASYVYDLRPIVHDFCEAMLPFGEVLPSTQPVPQPTVDAGTK